MDGKKTNLTDPMTFVGMNDISNVDFRLNKKGFKLGDFDCEADLDCQRMGSGNGANRLIMSTKIDQIGWVNLKLANKGYIDRSNEDEVAANDEAKLVFDLGKFSKEVHTDLSASLEYDLCAKAAALRTIGGQAPHQLQHPKLQSHQGASVCASGNCNQGWRCCRVRDKACQLLLVAQWLIDAAWLRYTARIRGHWSP